MHRLFICLLLSVLTPGLVHAASLTFSGIKGSANSDISQRVLEEAYQTLGIEIVIELYPGKRALALSGAGQVDGELFRIDGIENQFPNLIKVPTPINVLEGVYIAMPPHPVIKDWAALAPYTVGTQRGIKFVDKGLQGIPMLRRLTVNKNDQLLVALETGRIDVAIMARLNALVLLTSQRSSKAVIGENPLVVHPLYHYLHRSHEHLVGKLNQVLQTMKKEGRINAIRQHYINDLGARSSSVSRVQKKAEVSFVLSR